MNMLLRAGIAASALVVLLATTGCPSDPNTPNDPSGLSGTLYVNGFSEAKVQSIDLKIGNTSNMFAGSDPYRTAEGTFIVRTILGLEEVSANGLTTRMIVPENKQAPMAVTYDNAFQNPQLSPDGKYIAYEGHLSNAFPVFVVDRNTGELLLSLESPEYNIGYTRPSWTPDNRLVVAGLNTNPGIYITDAGWTTLTRIDDNITFPDQPRVSPDGTQIVLTVNQHVHTMNIDGSALKQITTSTSVEERPTWSPDGKNIAIYSNGTILILNPAAGTIFDVKSISANAKYFVERLTDRAGQFFWQP